MRLFTHLSYANVVATLALFLALGGTAAAGSRLLITGADVKDHSLTGIDFKEGSIGMRPLDSSVLNRLHGPAGPMGPAGPAGPAGTQGSAGAQGAAGTGIATTVVTGSDQSNYVDLTPLATYTTPGAGDYVIFTQLTVHNTGGSDEYLNCGYETNGVLSGASGVSTTAGSTVSGVSAGVISADGPSTVQFLCQGGGSTTYDISAVQMRVHFLG